MKKAVSLLGCLLFRLVVLLPLGVIFSAFFGYTFDYVNYSVTALFTDLLSACIAILSVIKKVLVQNKFVSALFALMAPFSLINAAFYLFRCSKLSVLAGMLVCVGCCFYLAVQHGKPVVLKIIGFALSALIVLPICFFALLAVIFGDLGQNSVVNSVASPNGKYYAEVIDSDQGAMGGGTFVDVYKNDVVNVYPFKISAKPQRVYRGQWGEFKYMEIYWKSEDCLMINSTECIIK